MTRLGDLRTWRLVLPTFVAFRGVTILIPILYVWQGSHTAGLPGGDEILGAFNRWDTPLYTDIAQYGYPAGHLDVHDAFLPGYPIALRVVMTVLGNPVVAGMVVSSVAMLVGLYFLARLVETERDEDDARFSVWAVALYPYAFFLGLAYTDAMFFAAAAATLYLARQGRHLPACAVAVVASCTRVFGVALLPVLLIEQIRQRVRDPVLPLAALCATLGPLALFSVYLRAHVGDFFGFTHAEDQFFGVKTEWPWSGAHVTWDQVVGSLAPAGLTWTFAAELAFGIGGLVLCILAWINRRVPVSVSTYGSLAWLLSVSHAFWRSVPRYEMAMFPLVLVLVDLTRGRSQVRTMVLTSGAALLSLGTTLFASGRFMG